MPNDTYNAGDILDKTLFASVPVKVYISAPPFPPGVPLTEFLVGTVQPGDPVGQVYSYLAADPTKGRANLWWMFSPASNYSKYYYAEHKPGIFDVSALRSQGVITTLEKKREEEEQNKPWYERAAGKLIGAIGTGILIFGVGSLIINLSKQKND